MEARRRRNHDSTGDALDGQRDEGNDPLGDKKDGSRKASLSSGSRVEGYDDDDTSKSKRYRLTLLEEVLLMGLKDQAASYF